MVMPRISTRTIRKIGRRGDRLEANSLCYRDDTLKMAMHMNNYTLEDILGSIIACGLFIPLLLAPGYVAAWFSGVLHFRDLSAPWRILISLPLSVAVCPIATYWLGLTGSWVPVFALYGICLLIFLFLLAQRGQHELRALRSVPRSGWIIAGVWFVVAVASLVNIQIRQHLYLSFTDYDHVSRAAITDAISRGGVRPPNPFYFLNSLTPLRYHYFWFLLCSIVTQAGAAVSSQQAIIASAVWCGWSLIALVPLYLRFLCGNAGAFLRRASLIAIALFAVTGLDFIPTVLMIPIFHGVLPEMEWWNEQVTAWFGSLLWVPHNVAALVACLMGFLLTWDAGRNPSRPRRIVRGVFAGAAFATAAGTSIYVTLVFAVFLTVWTVITMFRRSHALTEVLVVSGMIAIILAIPYLRSLTGPGSGGAFVEFEIRQFNPLNFFAGNLEPFPAALMRLIALPLNYFLELGFFGVAAIVFLADLRKRGPLQLQDLAAITMAGVSVAICTFVRSGTLGNDLGWRGFLPAQFIMLLWGAQLIAQGGLRAEAEGRGFYTWWLRSPVWAPLILIGFAGTVYEVTLLRTWFVWNDAGLTRPTVYSPDRVFGKRAFELRRAYDTLNRILPANAKVQSAPEERYFDFYDGLYSRRQTVVGGRGCGTMFGGDTSKCPPIYAEIASIFEGIPGDTWPRVEAICRKYSIDALVITDFDQVWQRFGTWAAQVRPAIAENHVRVYLIGGP